MLQTESDKKEGDRGTCPVPSKNSHLTTTSESWNPRMLKSKEGLQARELIHSDVTTHPPTFSPC